MPRQKSVASSSGGDQILLTASENDARDADELIWFDEELPNALNAARDSINAALSDRLSQGISWAWSTGTTQYAVPLNSVNREFLKILEGKFIKNKVNPHKGYLQFNGVKLLASGGGPLPDAAAEEIIDFCGDWGLEISRIALGEKATIDGMDLATVKAYDPSAINWTVTWVDRTDWIDDLVLYNP